MNFIKKEYLLPALLAVLGFIVSLISSIIGGIDWISIIIRPIISALIMAGIGFSIFYSFKEKIIEVEHEIFDDPIEHTTEGDSTEEQTINNNEQNIDENTIENQNIDTSHISDTSSSQNMGTGSSYIPKTKNKNYQKDGHLVVEGVPIKNEPNLMAEAIKHLLAKDEEDNPENPNAQTLNNPNKTS